MHELNIVSAHAMHNLTKHVWLRKKQTGTVHYFTGKIYLNHGPAGTEQTAPADT